MVKRAVRWSERPNGMSRGQLEGVGGKLNGLGGQSGGRKGQAQGGRKNEETEKRRNID